MWYQEHSPLNGLKCFDNGFRHKKIHFWSNTEQSVWSLSCVQLFSTPRTAARQVSLSVTNSQNLLRLMAIKLVMPSNHLILCRLLLLLPSIFPSIRVFSSESVLRIRWPKYWSVSFSISPSNEHPGLVVLLWPVLIYKRKENEASWLLCSSCL